MDENLTQALAAVLRAEQGSQNVTARELAERTGFAEVSISRWLNGHRDLNTEKLEKLAAALGVPAWELMRRAQERLDKQHEDGHGHEVVTFRKSES